MKLLVRRRDQYRATKNAPFDAIEKLTPESRKELVIQTAGIITQHASAHGVKEVERVYRAGLAGCGDIVAFLEMIARIKGKRSDEIFNEEDYRMSAGKSLPTLLDFATTSNDADNVIAINISTWTRDELKRKSIEERFSELQFDESFFVMQDDGAVQLRDDDTIRKSMLDENGKNFDFSASKYDILFGCPFRQQLVFLYPRMLNAMLSNGFPQEAYALAQCQAAYGITTPESAETPILQTQ